MLNSERLSTAASPRERTPAARFSSNLKDHRVAISGKSAHSALMQP
jgi:hypothetical protein